MICEGRKPRARKAPVARPKECKLQWVSYNFDQALAVLDAWQCLRIKSSYAGNWVTE
jgi:hypothetical protein